MLESPRMNEEEAAKVQEELDAIFKSVTTLVGKEDRVFMLVLKDHKAVAKMSNFPTATEPLILLDVLMRLVSDMRDRLEAANAGLPAAVKELFENMPTSPTKN